jgi:hypothetical protein
MTSHVVVVTVEVTGNKPCGAFTNNATFYFRAGLRDVKHFMYSYQSQVSMAHGNFFGKNPHSLSYL